jgi:hypothetical protein
LIKLAVESHNGNERELMEYFALDFENYYDGMLLYGSDTALCNHDRTY